MTRSHSLQDRSRNAGAPDPTMRRLSSNRQRLVRLGQRLYFGTILNLPFRDGEPILDPRPRAVRRQKNGGHNQARPQADLIDFALKREWVDFFADLVAQQDGVILVIEIAHGVPIVHEYEVVIEV